MSPRTSLSRVVAATTPSRPLAGVATVVIVLLRRCSARLASKFFKRVNLGNQCGGVNGFQLKSGKIARLSSFALYRSKRTFKLRAVHEIGGRVVRGWMGLLTASPQAR